MVLKDRSRTTTRLQCGSCGAHALVGTDDYRELMEHGSSSLRCEVCGAQGRLTPTPGAEAAPRERPPLFAR